MRDHLHYLDQLIRRTELASTLWSNNTRVPFCFFVPFPALTSTVLSPSFLKSALICRNPARPNDFVAGWA